MPITFTTGNLLDAQVEALVNTVNTVGVMGKGIALMFKDAFPGNYLAYRDACDVKAVRVGHMFVTERRDSTGGLKWIINFPTKEHWRSPSRVEWIEDGLIDLRNVIEHHDIKSVALPALGCGNGGLDWKLVRPRIVHTLEPLSDVEIIIYEPTTQMGKQRTVIAGLRDAVAYAEGDVSAARVTRYGVPQNIDVAAPPDFALTPSEREKVFPKRGEPPASRGYAAPPGSGPEGETCGSCTHRIERHFAKVYHKCALMSAYWTGSVATDIRVRSPACSRWERRDA